jgi:hypothetical protein
MQYLSQPSHDLSNLRLPDQSTDLWRAVLRFIGSRNDTLRITGFCMPLLQFSNHNRRYLLQPRRGPRPHVEIDRVPPVKEQRTGRFSEPLWRLTVTASGSLMADRSTAQLTEDSERCASLPA